jgi:hypothetical protein
MIEIPAFPINTMFPPPSGGIELMDEMPVPLPPLDGFGRARAKIDMINAAKIKIAAIDFNVDCLELPSPLRILYRYTIFVS